MLRARVSGVVLSLGLPAILASWSAIAPRALAAQATTVSLGGLVVADGGRGVGGARLELRERETGVTRVVATDAAGRWRALGLAPGTWEIVVRALGYRQVTHERVRLVLGQQATLDVTLERAATELAPTVITGERSLEVQRADLSTPVLQEEMEPLPLNSRNVHNLAAIAPGIRTYAAEGGRSVPASGPMPSGEPRFSNFYVDGLEWKGMFVGQVVAVPAAGSMLPQEAVREFRVYLHPYDAEHTRGASYVISAVTHRGGDTMKGSLFSFVQNRALVAKGAFDAQEPRYGRWQFGGNLRGPAVRDRLYFSASYEGQSTDDYPTVVPPRTAENPDAWNAQAGQFRAPNRHHTGLLRLTAPVGAHTLDAIWATRHIRGENGFGTQLNGWLLAHEAGLLLGSRVNSVHLRDTYASSSFVNELSLHVLASSYDNDLLVPGPTRRYERSRLQFGRDNYPARIGDRRLSLVEKASYTHDGPTGRHLLKGGVELRHARSTVFRPFAVDGVFRYATDTSTLPVEAVIGVGVSDPSSDRGARGRIDGWLVGAFVQDQWQPVRTLTLGAGVRWDVEIGTLNQDLRTPWAADTALRRAYGDRFLNAGDRATDWDNVAPRLFASWDPTGAGRTFVRGGLGVVHDRVGLYGAMMERLGVEWRTYSFPNPGTTDTAELRRRVAAGGGTLRPNLVLLADRLRTPENLEWSVGVGTQPTPHLALSVDYARQRIRHAYVSVLTNPLNRTTRQRPVTMRYGDITLWDDFGNARFDALLASLVYDRRPHRLSVAWTLARAESEFGEFTTSGYGSASAYTMQQSEGDERHRVVVSGLTRLPLGLELSGIAIAASPRPFLVTAGTDVNANDVLTDDWPDGSRTLRRGGWEHWYRTVDLRLARTIPFAPGALTVTGEVFNAFNWANHAEYRAVRTAADYGQPVGDFARRQVQLGVRYLF